MENTIDLARRLVDAIEDKKGEKIVLMDIHLQSTFADYFIICSGASERQLKAILDVILETARKHFSLSPRHVEGKPDTGWILVDFDNLVVHIFSTSQRRYYNLEGLWKESPILLRVQ